MTKKLVIERDEENNHVSQPQTFLDKLKMLFPKPSKQKDLSWEDLLGSLKADVVEKMQENRNEFVFKVCLVVMTTNLLF